MTHNFLHLDCKILAATLESRTDAKTNSRQATHAWQLIARMPRSAKLALARIAGTIQRLTCLNAKLREIMYMVFAMVTTLAAKLSTLNPRTAKEIIKAVKRIPTRASA